MLLISIHESLHGKCRTLAKARFNRTSSILATPTNLLSISIIYLSYSILFRNYNTLKGKLKHGDSKQNSRTITTGDIQTMSAGTGIYHSEMNGSDTEPVEFLQIWVMPEKLNTPPAYQDYDIRPYLHKNELALIVSPDGNAPAKLLQQTWFSIGEVEAGKKLGYHLHQSHAGVYIFLIEGEIKVDGTILSRRDGMGVYETASFELETLKDSHILLIEVPM